MGMARQSTSRGLYLAYRNIFYHNRYNITTMKKKDLIYIPHQDTWTEHFPNPGSNKNGNNLYLSDPQAQYNKLLRTQQKLRNKKK